MILPSPDQVDRRLRQMLATDSARTGGEADTARLMLMLTRSCELRCAYCFVSLTESGFGEAHAGRAVSASADAPPVGDLAPETARRAVDLLMTYDKPRLSVQLFGGEPTRRWDLVSGILDHALRHSGRRGRDVSIQLTTNGLALDASRLGELGRAGVTIQLSVDGVGIGNRFRRPHHFPQSEADTRWAASFAALRAGGAAWFLNVTVPPAAATELPHRHADARALGAPALQLNYATGVPFSGEAALAYQRGLAAVLTDTLAAPDLRLFNRHPGADPAPLCGDTLCDVDGTLLQIGGVFFERRFPQLRRLYTHGHLDHAERWDSYRASLGELWRRTRAALPPEDAALFLDGMRLGAASDLIARLVAAQKASTMTAMP